jgi:serine/threonine protein kinase
VSYASGSMAAACGHCGQLHEAYVTMCPVTGGRLGSASYTLVNEDELLVGTVVGERYQIRDILNQGSTGTVFGTVHVHFARNAAMKVLRPRFASLDTVQRVFHNESRLAFSVSHPSLCEVFDIGSLPDGAPFFVMERLEGDTLASRLGRERFSVAAAVDLMMQLLSVMEAVHARDLLLRDLRPQNVFLTHRRGCRPVLKVMDFGLARLIPLEKVQQQWDGLRAVVGANDVSGVLSIPYYLSPERTRGEQGLEPASDIFVATTILYEALTGQKPFLGSTWNALLTQVVQGQPTPLTVLRPDVPEDLGALLMRALSSNPRARPASAREMQDELRGVFEAPRRGSASMRAAPPSPPKPPPRPAAGVKPEEHLDVTVSVPPPIVDEASAEHPIRTLRPPSAVDMGIDIDVVVEHEEPAATSRGGDIAASLLRSKRRTDEEDETETMQLTPEVRARIEAMTRQAAASAASVEDSTRPPPTRRLTKPGSNR